MGIITQREIKPFRNLSDLIDRTNIDTTYSSDLERLLIFNNPQKTTLNFKYENSRARSAFNTTYNNCKISATLRNKEAYSFNIIIKKLCLGRFGLNWRADGFIPTLNEDSYVLLFNSPIQAAIGKNKIAFGGKINLCPHKIVFGLIGESDKKILTYLHSKLFLSGATVDIDFTSPEREIKFELRTSGYATRFKSQIKIKEHIPYFSYYFQRKISKDLYFSASSHGNSQYVSISKLFKRDVNIFLKTKITPKALKFQEISIQGKTLDISYIFTDQEKLGLFLTHPLFSVGLTQYIRRNEIKLKFSFDFNFQKQNATIDLELNKNYLKFELRYNA